APPHRPRAPPPRASRLSAQASRVIGTSARRACGTLSLPGGRRSHDTLQGLLGEDLLGGNAAALVYFAAGFEQSREVLGVRELAERLLHLAIALDIKDDRRRLAVARDDQLFAFFRQVVQQLGQMLL